MKRPFKKTNFQKIATVLGAISLILLFAKQDCLAEPSKIQMNSASDANEILPLEPVQCMLTIQNTSSDEPIEMKGSWDLFVQYRREGTTNEQWQIYHPENTPLPTPRAPTIMRLAPKEQRHFLITLAYDSIGAAVFNNAGVYQVKLSYGHLEAATFRITVRQPRSPEAYTYLLRSQIPRFFSLESSRVSPLDGVKEDIQTFYKMYPESEYLPLILTAEALISLIEDKVEAAIPVLKEVSRYEDARGFRASIYLAHSFKRIRNYSAREILLESLAKQRTNPVFRAHAESLLAESE